MASCEKCWRDAGGDPDRYHELIHERNGTPYECTPEQQAGEDATTCRKCDRVSVHMHVGVCMSCGFRDRCAECGGKNDDDGDGTKCHLCCEYPSSQGEQYSDESLRPKPQGRV